MNLNALFIANHLQNLVSMTFAILVWFQSFITYPLEICYLALLWFKGMVWGQASH